jgi:catalase
VNDKGKGRYVKYHWKPAAGIETIDRHESTRLAGEDPDVATRDLYDWIASGKPVEFELKVQLMEFEDEFRLDFDPLDATKTWPEDKYPLMPVGKIVLDKNPENYFAEVEQAAFCPASIIPGIEPSADKLLQGRLFSYADTQRHRLGPNYLQIPINRPNAAVNNNTRDGSMQNGEGFSGTVNYEPNTLGGGMPEQSGGPIFGGRPIVGEEVRRKIALTNDFQQAGERYRSLSKKDQDHLVDNIIDPLSHAKKEIQKRMVANLTKADVALGKRVAKGLKL